jgi:hypothetical protein
MARPLRVEYPGARYHLMSRGDRREAIVLDESDPKLWIRTLKSSERGQESSERGQSLITSSA